MSLPLATCKGVLLLPSCRHGELLNMSEAILKTYYHRFMVAPFGHLLIACCSRVLAVF